MNTLLHIKKDFLKIDRIKISNINSINNIVFFSTIYKDNALYCLNTY